MEITREMIQKCVSDTSIGGKFYQLYSMLIEEMDNEFSEDRMERITETLDYVGICDTSIMSKAEKIFEYSQLI